MAEIEDQGSSTARRRAASVYVAHTGGTIGMKRTPQGYAPAPGYLEELMGELPQLRSDDVPDFVIHEYETLLDSSNMTPSSWNLIAGDIAANYDRYDGFVVLHGTDTMAYTASALSFMIEGLTKPVVVTGSQIPLCEVRSDALDNLITSLIIAGTYDIAEVCLYFHGKLLRGNRAIKMDSAGFGAFDSPNHPPLGVVGVDIAVAREYLRTPDGRPFRVQDCGDASVAAMRLFPGITGDVVANILRPPLKGLVLGSYGRGTAPSLDGGFLDALREACARGVVVVAVTQCVKGRVDLGGYEAGSVLGSTGVVGGHDLTVEAALAKLCYLFALGLDPPRIRAEIQRDLRGEITPPR
ncbi:MAG: asparaginase [Alphaproteobacteria bacterium]|nr:asparaginase [Alphaproteobacteria bacterium]